MSRTLPTIVLVHGAWHGSWCWADVQSSLEQEGFRVVAVDLPGHEAVSSSSRKWNTMSSYVAHVEAAVDEIAGPVVLAGHSMGGLVTQRVLERRDVALGVLVASAPLRGVAATLARLTRAHPGVVGRTLVSLSLWPLVDNDGLVRSNFFGADTDEAVVSSAAAKMQNESYVAFLSMLSRWPRPAKVNSPVQVIAGRDDAIFTLAEQRALAAAYKTELIVIDAAHDLMLEPQWPVLAEHLSRLAHEVAN